MPNGLIQGRRSCLVLDRQIGVQVAFWRSPQNRSITPVYRVDRLPGRGMILLLSRVLFAVVAGAIVMHMPVAPQIDKSLLEKAKTLTGLQERTALLNAGLEALIARESARRLVALGGTQKKLAATPRRRPAQNRNQSSK